MAAMYGDAMQTQAWNPFSASPLQAGPQQGAFLPQGADFGTIAQQIAGRVAQQLPGVIMNLIASSPQLSQAIGQQGVSAWQGGQLQSPAQWGIGGLAGPQLYGGGMGLGQLGAGQLYGQQFQPQLFGRLQPQLYGQQWQPQQFGQFQPQQYGQQFQPQQFGQLQQQGIDIGVVQQIAGMVGQQLPGMITSFLASSPQISQAIRQQAASQMGYGGGAGFSPIGAGQQQQPGSDLAARMAQQVAGTVAQQLSGMIMNVLASSPFLWGGPQSTAIH
jgi:hypothetical protein